ncbi:MAG: hypothetical protein VXU41_01305 [Pseudomonadota bacterium]|nr:hypothetical protein [Pseudomonadota bacterium]
MSETEQLIWSFFQMGYLISAMSFIGTIIAIWLALRVANMTRENSESNIVTKLLSTGFGLCVVAGSWIQFTLATVPWRNASEAITNFGVDNMSNPERAQGFIDYVGNIDGSAMPTPLGMAFLIIILLMILGLIWGPKNN